MHCSADCLQARLTWSPSGALTRVTYSSMSACLLDLLVTMCHSSQKEASCMADEDRPSLPTHYDAREVPDGNGWEAAATSNIARHAPPRQRALILRWLSSLIQIAAVDAVWL